MPLPGVQVVEAPSERLLQRAVELSGGATVVIDMPPGIERLVRAAIAQSELVVIPTPVGGVEVSRIRNDQHAPVRSAYGIVAIAGRARTEHFRQTVSG